MKTAYPILTISTAGAALSLIIDPAEGNTFGTQPLVRRFMADDFKLIPQCIHLRCSGGFWIISLLCFFACWQDKGTNILQHKIQNSCIWRKTILSFTYQLFYKQLIRVTISNRSNKL